MSNEMRFGKSAALGLLIFSAAAVIAWAAPVFQAAPAVDANCWERTSAFGCVAVEWTPPPGPIRQVQCTVTTCDPPTNCGQSNPPPAGWEICWCSSQPGPPDELYRYCHAAWTETTPANEQISHCTRPCPDTGFRCELRTNADGTKCCKCITGDGATIVEKVPPNP